MSYTRTAKENFLDWNKIFKTKDSEKAVTIQKDNNSFLKIAKENFLEWNEALQTKNPEKVAAMYEEDNSFLPTISPDFKQTREEAANYFEHFLAKNPFGEIKTEKVQVLSGNSYLHSGLYDFEIDGEDGRTVVEARFSYVWKMIDGEWKIIHHHSSVKPS